MMISIWVILNILASDSDSDFALPETVPVPEEI